MEYHCVTGGPFKRVVFLPHRNKMPYTQDGEDDVFVLPGSPGTTMRHKTNGNTWYSRKRGPYRFDVLVFWYLKLLEVY